ncbi:P-loop containing nucleoside triphosphate hydrolase protein [Pyronema domesticum]|uniref:Kinesin-like protein n=1 Tax=Pyronema omphalodes (strain CBS 100304) TaxID=1076935 RepID=U4LHR4_PYROM|nr:P-loop containing nucleoside triphosphate hydrolase protein [Pyronema domesticum]CCX31463.1 Similar to Kinesin-like protein 6; acc. no. O59751 [Pyronema omphalodes CBS 100304]
MSSASSISVVVRVRPFSIREAAQLTRVDDAPAFFGDGALATPKPTLTGKGVRRVVKVIDDHMLVFDPAEENPMAKYQKTILPQGKRVKDMRFGFDRVFDETCSQQDVYEATTKSLLDSVLDGFNATVFAYGATGCGKTHTISGNPSNPGIIFLTCAELFQRIDALVEEKEIHLTLSYLEIYNETIRDLLVPGGSKIGLQLREDNNKNISVSGLSQHTPRTVEEVMDMIVMGNANRTQSPTEANAASSRSHAVLQINVVQKPRTAGLSEDHMASTLSIIDLAGSERASVTKNRGERLLEGANINRSLLALGNCINSLCDAKTSNHVPYRDSKLTRLLKFSLGGNCRTVMIVCVSPSSQHYDETHNTLKYANRAKNIKTKVSRNIINVNRHVSQYVKAIYDLRQEVDALKTRLKDSTKEALNTLTKQRAAKDACIKDGLRRIRDAFEQTTPMRDENIRLLQNLRMVERRIQFVNAWLDAFESVYQAQQAEEPNAIMLKMQGEAEKVLQELTFNEQGIKEKLNGINWERAIHSTLQSSLKNLQAIDGVVDADVAMLNTEATLWMTMGERDVQRAIATLDVNFMASIQLLSKAHFETYATINKIMNTNITEAEALEEARKSLFEIQKGAGDAMSHIVKPTGELVSQESYKPSAYKSPKKNKHTGYGAGYSPFKPSTSNEFHSQLPISPARPSPRHIKHKSPKKGVVFGKKVGEKKRVRWTEELVDPVSENSHRRIIVDDAYFSGARADGADEEEEEEDDEEYIPQRSQLAAIRSNNPYAASSGVSAPPIRPPPRNKMLAPLGSKKAEPTPPDSEDNSGDNSPTNAYDSAGLSGNYENRPATHRPAMRMSISGAIQTQKPKRRSPSRSSVSSSDSIFGIGFAKRLPNKGERTSGHTPSVLSPKSSGIKAGARRLTVNSASVQGLSNALAQASLPQLLGTVPAARAGGGK